MSTVEVLDAKNEHTDAWREYDEQTKRVGTIPKGTYEGTLNNVAIVKRKDDDSWVLRLIARTNVRGQMVVAWQGLSEDPDDPFAMTETQAKSVVRFAGRLGIEPHRLLDDLSGLLGKPIVVKVSQTRVGQRVVLSREVKGEIVDSNGHDPERAVNDAQAAHEKILHGLSTARLALAECAEGCHDLHVSKGWETLGYDSLSEYLAAPEITLSRTEFYRMVDIWKSYVLEGGLPPMQLQGAGETKLAVPLPALKDGLVSAEQAVSDATALTRKELESRYDEITGKEPKEREVKPKDMVPVDVARSLVAMLERILAEIGDPRQKRMSNALRAAVVETLELAHRAIDNHPCPETEET